MTQALDRLGNISVDEFLRDYWQQKPLLIRQAFANFESPLSPDELAGLALEEEIESRIILENHQGSPWQLRCGPFEESAFTDLPEKNWTLLVQALDHYIPELHELLQQFRFLPSWRLDDIMASYAVDGGSVGPHYDHYDVFLLQGHGKRHWQIGQQCTQDDTLLPGTPLNILKDFTSVDSYLLEPGDMLYLPPKFAHWGIAQGECITYSVGFRAPSHAQLVEEFFQDIEPSFSEFQRYQDPGLGPRAHSGEITPDDIARVMSILQERLKPTAEGVGRWLGRLSTELKYDNDSNSYDADTTATEIALDALPLLKAYDARFSFTKLKGSQAALFANGTEFLTSLELAVALCENDIVDQHFLAQHPDSGPLLNQLIELNALMYDDE